MAKNKINLMGSEVVEGYECKPKDLDINKPIMHYKNLINICVDKRCSSVSNKQQIETLRSILKDMKLDNKEDRIKIVKTLCFGACRYKQVANIVSNTQQNGLLEHNNIWLKATNEYDINKWKELFLTLKENRTLNKFEQIKMKVF
jgi:cobalt-precorrin 5A hydrolase